MFSISLMQKNSVLLINLKRPSFVTANLQSIFVWDEAMVDPHGQKSVWDMSHTSHTVPAPMHDAVTSSHFGHCYKPFLTARYDSAVMQSIDRLIGSIQSNSINLTCDIKSPFIATYFRLFVWLFAWCLTAHQHRKVISAKNFSEHSEG